MTTSFYRDLLDIRGYMLTADVTYRELAGELGLSASRVHALLNTPNPRAHERTQHKVRQLVETKISKPKRTRR